MTIVHLASHYIQHHFCVPRILSDLAQAWTKWHSTLDLDDLRSLAAHTGVLPTLEYALHAAHELGLTPAAPLEWESPAAARLRRILPPARLLETPRGRGYARTLASLLLVKPGSAAAWLLRSTLPPPEVMSAIYEELALSGPLRAAAGAAVASSRGPLRGPLWVPTQSPTSGALSQVWGNVRDCADRSSAHSPLQGERLDVMR